MQKVSGLYKVKWKSGVKKQVEKLPKDVRMKFFLLVDDILQTGPVQKKWKNFSELGKNEYHCHLTYHYVACWTYDKAKKECIVEIYYVGSRENAPY